MCVCVTCVCVCNLCVCKTCVCVCITCVCVCVQLTAEDVDSQVNGEVEYSIISGDRDKHFYINPATGLLKINKQLDREMVRHTHRLHTINL